MKFDKLLEKVYPQPPIGGLEISDSVIRLVQLKGGAPVLRAYQLPRGVVEGGQLKDKAKLMPILRQLVKASGGEGKLGLVLTLASNNVFVQTVNLPPAALANLTEAAELNVRMVSPLREGEYYYDWQRISKEEAGKPIELLAAFVSRQSVKDLTDCLEEAGFSLVAVEFTSLSLVREIKRRGIIKSEKPYLLAEVAPEGMTFMLVSSGQLLFHSSRRWGGVQEEAGKIEVNEFLKTLIEEVSNVSNFYLAHWGGVIDDLIFITAGLENEIKAAFKDKAMVFLKPEEVSPASGALTRSIVDGKEINLLGTSSPTILKQNRALTFVNLWRNVLITTFGFLLLLSLGTDLFLKQLSQKTAEADALTLNEPGHKELLALKEKASKFNQLTALLKEVRQKESRIGPVALMVNNLAGAEIKINRLYIPSSDSSMTLNGTALDEQAAIAFKNRLVGEKSFTEVELPLSAITPETGGRVSFTIYFRIAKP